MAGHLFHLFSLSADGAGGSYSIDGTATSSGGGTLSLHTNFHIVGTAVKLDEANTYATPEVQFNLTAQAGYQLGLLNISCSLAIDASGRQPTSVRGNVQKSSSSKAAAVLTRGAYSQYVSTAKGRERRWRLFSTFPNSIRSVPPDPNGG